jgi:hypothetical protein
LSGFCFLWDRRGDHDPAGLGRIGAHALDALSHAFAPNRAEESGEGWWLGLCRGDGEPQVALASDRRRQVHVLLSGWLENYSELGAADRTAAPLDDAALVLALYLRRGPEILDRLRGPLVSLVWEPRIPRLMAVRDHVGERAVCFADGRGPLALASEEAALLHHPDVSKAPDLGWLARFGVRFPLPAGRTAFRDISELAPGESVVWQTAETARRHVPLGFPVALRRGVGDEDALTCWRESLATGIPAATRRGRRFGLMLSGGMDSTTAAAFAVPAIRAGGREVAAYCWRLERFKEADESRAIAEVAAHIGVPVRWFEGDGLCPSLDPENWPICPNLPWLNPFLHLNLAAYGAARAEGCDVLINGHLGDYLYPYRHQGLTDALQLRDWGRATGELRRLIRDQGPARWLISPEMRDLAKRSLRIKWRRAAPAYLAGPAVASFGRITDWPPEIARSPHPAQLANLFGTISAMESKGERYFADRSGVERRHPLRHAAILACVLSLPSYLFCDGRTYKRLTQKAMTGRLPRSVLHGPPGGRLNPLFLEGFFGDGGRLCKALLSGATPLWAEVFRRDYVDEALARGRETTAEQQRVLVAAVGIALWCRALDRG